MCWGFQSWFISFYSIVSNFIHSIVFQERQNKLEKQRVHLEKVKSEIRPALVVKGKRKVLGTLTGCDSLDCIYY